MRVMKETRKKKTFAVSRVGLCDDLGHAENVGEKKKNSPVAFLVFRSLCCVFYFFFVWSQ